MEDAVKKIVVGSVALLVGLMFVFGADSIDVVYSIVGRIVGAIGGSGTTTLGAVEQAKSVVKTTVLMLGIIFIAAGGALVLWGLFQVIGGTPMGEYWQ